MHPAYSVIIFTTFSGAGYGLAALLGLGLSEPAAMSAKVGYFIALGMISIGLISSTMHLGNPKNAIRAFSQWRSSWLSREGILAIITFIPLTVLAFLAVFMDTHIVWMGYLSAILCLATVFSTSMIYASLKTIRQWNSWLTPASYLLFALAGGSALLTALMAVFDNNSGNMATYSILILVAAWIIKGFWNKRQSSGFGNSSLETATGLGHLGKVRLLERPHMTENYLTREMGYRVARKHAAKLWSIAVFLGLILPVIALAVAFSVSGTGTATLLSLIAAFSHLVGMLVERWLFFANAKHVVSLYYGDDAVQTAR